MGVPAAFTYDTAYPKNKSSVRGFDRTVVVTMDRKASGVSTGAGELVKLEAGYHFIIKIWC